VQEIRVKEGDKIKVGQVIFTVDGAEPKASPAPPAQAAAPAPTNARRKPAPAPAATEPMKQEVRTSQVAGPTAPIGSRSGLGEFKLPELGENISQGDLVRLMISP